MKSTLILLYVNNAQFDKISPLNKEDSELLSDLKSIFDLGTQTIIGQDEDEIVDDLIELMTNILKI